MIRIVVEVQQLRLHCNAVCHCALCEKSNLGMSSVSSWRLLFCPAEAGTTRTQATQAQVRAIHWRAVGRGEEEAAAAQGDPTPSPHCGLPHAAPAGQRKAARAGRHRAAGAHPVRRVTAPHQAGEGATPRGGTAPKGAHTFIAVDGIELLKD